MTPQNNNNLMEVFSFYLTLKSNGSMGFTWSADEDKTVQEALVSGGVPGVLAGYAVVAGFQRDRFPLSVPRLIYSFRDNDLSPSVELLLYEAFLCLKPEDYRAYTDEIMSVTKKQLSSDK